MEAERGAGVIAGGTERERERRRVIKKEKKSRMRSCAFYRCGARAPPLLSLSSPPSFSFCLSLVARRMPMRDARVRVSRAYSLLFTRRTLPPLCDARLRTFAISLNPQTTSERVDLNPVSRSGASERARARLITPLYDLYPVRFGGFTYRSDAICRDETCVSATSHRRGPAR